MQGFGPKHKPDVLFLKQSRNCRSAPVCLSPPSSMFGQRGHEGDVPLESRGRSGAGPDKPSDGHYENVSSSLALWDDN